MISNENVDNYKVINFFKYYSFGLDHFSIQYHLNNSKTINFKLFVMALG
jgi:hypothetical protein